MKYNQIIIMGWDALSEGEGEHMRRGALFIAAFLVCVCVLNLLQAPLMDPHANPTPRDVPVSMETACVGMSAPPAPKPCGTALSSGPGGGLPASGGLWALAAALLMALPLPVTLAGPFARPLRRHRQRRQQAHRIHAPPMFSA